MASYCRVVCAAQSTTPLPPVAGVREARSPGIDPGGGRMGEDSEVVGTYLGVDVRFRDVWADDLEREFAVIRRILDDYPYIGMVSQRGARARRRA